MAVINNKHGNTITALNLLLCCWFGNRKGLHPGK